MHSIFFFFFFFFALAMPCFCINSQNLYAQCDWYVSRLNMVNIIPLIIYTSACDMAVSSSASISEHILCYQNIFFSFIYSHTFWKTIFLYTRYIGLQSTFCCIIRGDSDVYWKSRITIYPSMNDESPLKSTAVKALDTSKKMHSKFS